MADIAALALSVDSDQVQQATVALKELPKAASAAERAAQKWSKTTKEAGRSSEDFSKRVQRTIRDLEFERQQLGRSAAERARFNALRRAGVAEASAEGRAISASVRALQAQRAALESSSIASRALASAWRQLHGIALTLGAVFGARAILTAADDYVRFTNALKVAGVAGTAMAEVEERLFSAANRNGVEIGALSTLYSRAAITSNELGTSQNDLLKFVDGVTAALRVQGGSSASASGALLQLSQALGAGIVRAEEFNSILEGAFPIAQAAARGIDGMGGSVAKLRSAIVAGQVTSRQFFDGLLKGFTETEAQAAGMSLTVSAATTVLRNGFVRFLGALDQATGASAAAASAIAGLGRGLDFLAKNLGNIAEAAAVAGVALSVAFAPVTLSAMARGFGLLAAAGVSAINAITAAAMANPLVALATAITATLAAVYFFRDEIEKAIGIDVVEVARTAANFVIGSFRAAFIDLQFVFENFPDIIGAAVIGAANAVARGVHSIIQGVARSIDWLIEQANKINPFDAIPEIGDLGPAPQAGNPAAGRLSGALEQRNRDVQGALSTDYIGAIGRAFTTTAPGTAPGGAGGPAAANAAAAGNAAQNAAKKYAELTAELELTAAAQNKMTEAARLGEVAFQEQEATLQAQQKLLDIFGKKLDETDPRLRKVRDLMLSIAQGKVAEAFAVATTELEKQNVVLERQIELMNEAPEIQAREIALIKAKQEAEKAGTAVTEEMVEARRKAIEQNETLKSQAEELKKAQDLWTAPLKSALESIQSTAADAFEGMLESGKISFQSLGDIFKKTITRMIAEFLALATVRPVMSVLVNAISPSTAQQMGMGGTTSGGGGIFGNIGLGNLFGSNGFLNQPITFGGPLNTSSSSPASMAAPTGATGAGLGGLTWGGAIGGLGSIGMGAYSMATSKGAGGMLGGAAGILGGGLAMLGPMLGLGAAAGPIGMGIGLLGSLLPSLFGGTPDPVITDQTFGQLAYGPNGWTTSGGAWGPNANATAGQNMLGGVGNNISDLFGLFGGVTDPSKVWGLALQSIQQGNSKWNSSSTSSFLVDPSGNQELWRMNMDDMWNTGAAQVALRSVLGGAVGEISADMRSALEAIRGEMDLTIEKLGETVSAVMAIEKAMADFGRDVTDAEQAIRQVNESFDAMRQQAEALSLTTQTLTKIETERQRQLTKLTDDFAYGISQGLLELTNPVQAQLNDMEKARQEDLKRNDDFLRLVTGYADQRLQIEELYGKRRNDIVAQSLSSGINDLIRDLLPGGALAGVDPSSQLAGLRASANASYAQAIANPTQTLIDRAVSDARAFLQFDKSYTGGSTAYVRDQQDALSRLVNLQGAAMQGAGGSSDPATQSLLQQLLAATQKGNANSEQRNAELEKLFGMLTRWLANAA